MTNEDIKTVPSSSSKTKNQTNEKTKTESKATEVTGGKDKDLSCGTQNLLPTCSTDKSQKTGSTNGSCNTKSGSVSCGNNSGSVSCGNNSGIKSNCNNSSINSSFNNSSISSSVNNSSINSGVNNSSINSSVNNSSINSSGTEPGFILSSTGFDESGGGASYGSARIISSKSNSIQGSKESRPVANTAEAIGLKELQPKIEENFARTNLISGPSKRTSFLIGFLGTLLILFTIMRRRN